jgi:hypothetical protein
MESGSPSVLIGENLSTQLGGPSAAERTPKIPERAEVYQHDEQAVLRPDAAIQAQFKKRGEPKQYR